MRTTTKIITGIFLSIFILSLLHIIFYSFTDRKNYENTITGHMITIPQEKNSSLHIESCRVVVLELEQPDIEDGYYSYFLKGESGLFIQPASTTHEENQLFFPEALNDFITVQMNNDTLTVKIQLEEVRKKYGTMDETLIKRQIKGLRYGISISGFNLHLYMVNMDVINKLHYIQTYISNIEKGNLKIYALGDITIDSCKVNVIEPVLGYANSKLTITNSSAKALNFDLDNVRGWSIENCNIETRNFTGGNRNHTITFTPSERGTINWLPKHKDAELNIKIKGDTTKIVL